MRGKVLVVHSDEMSVEEFKEKTKLLLLRQKQIILFLNLDQTNNYTAI